MRRRPPRPTLFPYTTLFRPRAGQLGATAARVQPPERHRPDDLRGGAGPGAARDRARDRKSTRLNSSHVEISYAVFCLKKKRVGVNPVLTYVTDGQKKSWLPS